MSWKNRGGTPIATIEDPFDQDDWVHWSKINKEVDEKVQIISGWIDDGKIAPVDPYHLIFSIWSMTQHYADFDIQIKEILDHKKADSRFEDAEAYLTTVLTKTLQP